jgi:hypothetical protein
MFRKVICAIVAPAMAAGMCHAAAPSEPQLAHVVFFQLKESSEEPKVWKQSRADDPLSLVGKQVLINAGVAPGDRRTPIPRSLARVNNGQAITLDVAHREGEALTIVELTAEQRETVKQD